MVGEGGEDSIKNSLRLLYKTTPYKRVLVFVHNFCYPDARLDALVEFSERVHNLGTDSRVAPPPRPILLAALFTMPAAELDRQLTADLSKRLLTLLRRWKLVFLSGQDESSADKEDSAKSQQALQLAARRFARLLTFLLPLTKRFAGGGDGTDDVRALLIDLFDLENSSYVHDILGRAKEVLIPATADPDPDAALELLRKEAMLRADLIVGFLAVASSTPNTSVCPAVCRRTLCSESRFEGEVIKVLVWEGGPREQGKNYWFVKTTRGGESEWGDVSHNKVRRTIGEVILFAELITLAAEGLSKKESYSPRPWVGTGIVFASLLTAMGSYTRGKGLVEQMDGMDADLSEKLGREVGDTEKSGLRLHTEFPLSGFLSTLPNKFLSVGIM